MASAAERELFDRIVESTIDSLPPEVRELLDETPVVIDDEPSKDLLESVRADSRRGESDLCGLHTGVPLSERTFFDGLEMPNAVHLFRGPILRLADFDEDRLRGQIRITLLHELGHLHGFTEEELEALGYG